MIIRKPFLLFMILLICSFTIFGTQSNGRSVINSKVVDIAVLTVNGTTEIEIKSTAPFTYTIYKQSDPYHIIVDLQDTELGEFKDKLLVDSAGVLEIIPMTDEKMPNVARFEIALTVPADVEPIYKDTSLILAFDNPDVEETETTEAVAVDVEEEEKAFEPEEITETAVTAEEPFAQKKYVGESISIDFQDVELTHIFRLIAEISGYNIIVSPDVEGNFSMKLIDVPWDQALDVILRNYGLSKTVEGNIIRVAPTSVLAKEEQDIAVAKEAQEKAGDLVTEVYEINYAGVEEIKKAIQDAKILTVRGFISVDERTSSVIIKDVEQRHDEYDNLIKALDIPIPQVSINAKIVEIRSELQQQLGIQWGMFWEPADSRMTIGGDSALSGDTTGFNSDNPLMVNLPAIVGQGKGGNLGIGYINASGLFSLDLQISALESTGKARVISNPKITTSDNEEAKIMQGEKIPYQTVSSEGTQTEFMDAFLELTVTPHITPEGTVVMKLEMTKNEADFTRQVLGVPTIAIKEIKTQVLINNNDTLVIGGIFTTENTKNLEAVPGFSEIPLLGRLFKKKIDLEDKNELLIFITPRIVTHTIR
jgi:type IV pilus assembly protein PilQ